MYDELAHNYDEMIHWKKRLEREAPFLQRLFNEKKVNRVLDLACGTGHHAKMFSKWGCEVVGVDPANSLLEIARNDIDDYEQLSFIQADFLSFVDFVEGPFDLVLVLGNSLPHLHNLVELKKTFMSIHELLKPGGVILFQNRNYNKLLKTRERFQFPTTSKAADKQQIFFRFNDFEGEYIRFNIVHFTRVGERWIHNVYSHKLMPWKRDDLKSCLKDSGFVAHDFYGDFSGSPYDSSSSDDIIGLARKAI